MGNFEIGNRNERRRMLIGFALKNNLQITNSLFYKKKSRKMDLERTESFAKMKIDFILTSKVQIFKIVEIPNSINTGSATG